MDDKTGRKLTRLQVRAINVRPGLEGSGHIVNTEEEKPTDGLE